MLLDSLHDMTFFSFLEAAVASSTVFVVVTVVDIIKVIYNYGYYN